jgi:hypothetical protein
MPKTAVALVVVQRGGRRYVQQVPIVVPSLVETIAVQTAKTWARLVRTARATTRS